MSVSGTVFNLQRFSTHDGPGIRTTVFLKGCPNRCYWCHNPEGLEKAIEPQLSQKKCVGCGSCVRSCRYGAITLENGVARLHHDRCKKCLDCTRACLVGACVPSARVMTPEAVMGELLEDEAAYRASGGGVTLSGGEPLMQADFCGEILSAARKKAIHTAIETSGNAPWSDFEKVLPDTDLILYDLKHMDGEAHQKITGASNKLILDNARKLADRSRQPEAPFKLLLRLPVVPGANSDWRNVAETANFAKALGMRELVLIPFHNLGAYKYDLLGLPYPAADIKPMEKSEIIELQNKVNDILNREGGENE